MDIIYFSAEVGQSSLGVPQTEGCQKVFGRLTNTLLVEVSLMRFVDGRKTSCKNKSSVFLEGMCTASACLFWATDDVKVGCRRDTYLQSLMYKSIILWGVDCIQTQWRPLKRIKEQNPPPLSHTHTPMPHSSWAMKYFGNLCHGCQEGFQHHQSRCTLLSSFLRFRYQVCHKTDSASIILCFSPFR